jgi:hypothetical protein
MATLTHHRTSLEPSYVRLINVTWDQSFAISPHRRATCCGPIRVDKKSESQREIIQITPSKKKPGLATGLLLVSIV